MPSTTEGLLLATAGLFLLIALIGGGFELAAAKIPPVGKKARIGSAIAGLLFLALALQSIFRRQAPPVADHVVDAARMSVTTAPPVPVTPKSSPREPIDNLFKAWEKRDVDAYLDQWHPRGKQWIGAKSRSMSEIAERREKDFARYQRVQVIDYKVDIDDDSTDPVIARVTYSMRFQRQDGTWVSETDMRETYKLSFLKDENRWVIRENFDYFTK